MRRVHLPVGNRLLAPLSPRDRALIASELRPVQLDTGETLFQPGQDIDQVYFPGPGAIVALVLDLRDGVSAEAAIIGYEGAVGGVISEGHKPAFTHGIVQIGGPALALPIDALQRAKTRSHTMRDHFARYADCLLAQILQSVACNAVHDFDARLARWLLALQDRIGANELNITQAFVSEMLGVQRTYTTKIVSILERRGAVQKKRGSITIIDRDNLERQSCECYGYLRRHFERVLPGGYPDFAGRRRTTLR